MNCLMIYYIRKTAVKCIEHLFVGGYDSAFCPVSACLIL